MFADPMTSERR